MKQDIITLESGKKVIRKHTRLSVARKLREESLRKRTKAEIQAEKLIRSMFYKDEYSPEHIFKFRRFDFFFFKTRSVIEIDGGYHDEEEQKQYDSASDKLLLKKYNIKVYRVKNFDKERLLYVLRQIRIDTPKILKLSKKEKKRLKRRNKSKNMASNEFVRSYGMSQKEFNRRKGFPKPNPFKPRVILRKKV